MNAIKHFKTITMHRRLVRQGCFRVGLYKQGMLHDLSKYMPSEFWVGVKYYQGNRSPNNAEREAIGYSSAWLHHKGRNKHHYEYWIDYSAAELKSVFTPAPMPVRYVVEMFMDRIAASKIYNKGHYTDQDPLHYYEMGREYAPVHPQTRVLLEQLLTMLAEQGEEPTFAYIRNEVLKKQASTP